MKKINRKRLELKCEMVARLAVIPTANLKYVQGAIEAVYSEVSICPCSFSCVADGCSG